MFKMSHHIVLSLALILTGFFHPLFGSKNYSIVFIHIGEDLPPYISTALDQARLFNTDCPILLVANEKALKKFTPNSQSHITTIACETLKKTDVHKQFLEQNPRKSKVYFTCQRFFYLNDLMLQHRLKNVFHLENDVMLYAELDKMLPIFTNQYKGIGATFDNDDRGIAGFIFISNAQVMNKMAKFFADRTPQGLNDMQLLALFKKETSSSSIDHLPIISKEYIKKNNLRSAAGHVAKKASKYYNHIDLFESIFDAAALGQ